MSADLVMKIVARTSTGPLEPIFWISPEGKRYEVCADGYLKDVETGKRYGVMPNETLKEIEVVGKPQPEFDTATKEPTGEWLG